MLLHQIGHTNCTVVTLHDTDRRLQGYGVQMEVRVGAVPIDICSTTTTTTTRIDNRTTTWRTGLCVNRYVLSIIRTQS